MDLDQANQIARQRGKVHFLRPPAADCIPESGKRQKVPGDGVFRFTQSIELPIVQTDQLLRRLIGLDGTRLDPRLERPLERDRRSVRRGSRSSIPYAAS